MSSSLPLSLNPPLLHRHSPQCTNHNFSLLSITLIPKHSFHSVSKSHICFAFSSENSSNYEKEDARWLREEQRWLREEQRWLREEARWRSEREALLSEIETLKLKIEEMEKLQSPNLSVVTGLLQVLKKEVSRIAERGSSAVPLVVESVDAAAVEKVDEEEKEVVVEEVIKSLESGIGRYEEVKKKRTTLRKGSEGDEVRIMQEALQKQGFYCGDEDTEYFMFSSGTERAIKTWQATLGVPEDGIMTSELLEKLFMEQQSRVSGSTKKADTDRNNAATLKKEASNGAAVTSGTENKTVLKKGGAEAEVFQNRVFLLGENRWEDPSRLVGRNKQVVGSSNPDATTKCISCRGEGRLLCTECDGTGEPNIEEQFMEWVDEGAKCPYCEGLGFTTCDGCDGKKVT